MNKKGFTLIEVLIGLVILAVGLLAIAGMQITSTRVNFSSKNLTQATHVAEDGLEFLKNLPFDSDQLLPGAYNAGPNTISNMVFNRSYTVVANGSRITITYSVVWNEGTNHNVTLSTVRSL